MPSWEIVNGLTEMLAPRILPAPWFKQQRLSCGLVYYCPDVLSEDGVGVIFSVERQVGVGDTRNWIHVSASRRVCVPTYSDLARVKELFVGPERQAVQVFAPASEHVNLCENCLHLWALVDGRVVDVDFRREGGL